MYDRDFILVSITSKHWAALRISELKNSDFFFSDYTFLFDPGIEPGSSGKARQAAGHMPGLTSLRLGIAA